MSGLSKMIADFFVRENVIEHEEYEIYKYGSDILKYRYNYIFDLSGFYFQ